MKKYLSLLFISGAILAMLTSQQLKPLDLPSGLITQTKPIDSSVFVSPAPILGRPLVKLFTTQGDITIELRPDLAPNNVVNILAKLNTQTCDRKSIEISDDSIIQGCDLITADSQIKPEFSSNRFTTGSIGLSGNKLFIIKKESNSVSQSSVYLGQVISGLDVVNKLKIGDLILSSAILSK